jgi:ribonuclease HI
MPVEITADGSQKDRQGGWAAIVVSEHKNADSFCTVIKGNAKTKSSYFTEIASIVDALKQIPDGYKGQILVRSDHSGLVGLIEESYGRKRCSGRIKKKHFSAHKHEGILQELREELLRLNVRAKWIRGHAKDDLNNFVDRLARKECLSYHRL